MLAVVAGMLFVMGMLASSSGSSISGWPHPDARYPFQETVHVDDARAMCLVIVRRDQADGGEDPILLRCWSEEDHTAPHSLTGEFWPGVR